MLSRILGLLNISLFLGGLFNTEPQAMEVALETHGMPRYSKVVYLLLDALRIDSIVKTSKEGHIYNKMRFLYSARHKYTALSVSGIPTTTNPRVLGLATGAPSNYLSGAMAYFCTGIKGDSLIKQLLREKTLAFFGDKTWVSLFPELKAVSQYLLDPYGKHELDAKEDAAIRGIVESIGKYDAVIAHLINLDTYGHIYGTKHIKMEEQLQKYDRLVQSIYEKMDEDTLLVITSDHGVTDEGAHGGLSAQEMSSVCMFIAKNGRLREVGISEEIKKARRKYISQTFQEEYGWIKAEEEINVIHQDDILPTLCYLLGIPIPRMSCGNFIHELSQDTAAASALAKQKSEVLGIPFEAYKGIYREDTLFGNSKEEEPEPYNYYVKLNYELSNKMVEKFAGRNFTKIGCSAVLSLIIGIMSIIGLFRLASLRNMLLLLVLVMAAHSVYATIYEDYCWGLLFLALNPSLLNLVGTLLFLHIYKSPIESGCKYSALLGTIALPPHFNGNLLYIAELMLFSALDNMNTLTYSPLFTVRSAIKTLNDHPRLVLPIARYFFPSLFEDSSLRLSLFVGSMSPDTLIGLMFRPMEAVYILYISRRLKISSDTPTLLSLLNMSFLYSGLKTMLSSINYSAIFVLCDFYHPASALVLGLFYLAYPRVLAMRRFRMGRKGLIDARDVLVFENIGMLVSIWASYFAFGTAAFYNCLGDKIFFQCFYYLCNWAIMLFLYGPSLSKCIE
jgi:GPI ethanolamine phosphate transferase 3 subunit O